MNPKLDIRSLESAQATEIYISAVPEPTGSIQDQAKKTFLQIKDLLNSRDAYVLEERIFASKSLVETISRIRSETYDDLDSTVPASFLTGKDAGNTGAFAGVQVHAVTGCKPQPVEIDGKYCGRIAELPGCKYLTLSGITAPQFEHPAEQMQEILKKTEQLLKQFGADFRSVPRTWMWLGDILSWYDEFNQMRINFFTGCGLLGNSDRELMPASTGIGIAPANKALCAMDLIAVLEPAGSVRYFQASSKQDSALKYGSAFSRACRAATPAGQTVFVSGTAAIDTNGATTNLGDPKGQIKTTIENIMVVLGDTGCKKDDVVQAIAYCKTTEVERIFNEIKSDIAWPWVTVICDICRPELLFEAEVTAMAHS